MRRIGAVVTVVGFGLAACGIDAEDRARAVDLPDPVETSLPSSDTDGHVDADAVAATVYLVDDDGLLHPANRSVPASDDPSIHLTAVIDAVLDGPTADELDRGLRSAVPAGVVANGVTVGDGLATIDLSRAFERVGGSEELLASAQLVLAVTAVPGVERARLLLDGEPSRLPRPDGSLVAEAVTRGDYLALLAS